MYCLSVPIFDLRIPKSGPTRSRIPVPILAQAQPFVVYYPHSSPTYTPHSNHLSNPRFFEWPCEFITGDSRPLLYLSIYHFQVW